MLLAKMARHAQEGEGGPSGIEANVISVPSCFTREHWDVVARAAAIAGLKPATLVPSWKALVGAYAFKYAAALAKPGAAPCTVLFADVGHAFTTAAVVRFTPREGDVPLAEPLAVSAEAVGSSALDDALFALGAAAIKEKFKGLEVARQSRLGARLMRQCERAKCTLSTVPDAKLEVENVADDRDFAFMVSRSQMEEASAPARAKIIGIVTQALRIIFFHNTTI